MATAAALHQQLLRPPPSSSLHHSLPVLFSLYVHPNLSPRHSFVLSARPLPFLSALPRAAPAAEVSSSLEEVEYEDNAELYHSEGGVEEEQEEEDEQEEGEDGEDEDDSGEEDGGVSQASFPPPGPPPPNLTVKAKKELASYAHSLGKKLKSQQVGKSGVTPSVAASFIENLERNELLKIKVHGNCPTELADAIEQLEKTTGSVAVGQIGRSVILYRPSISKMKKKEAESTRKVWKPKPRGPYADVRMPKAQSSRSPANGRSSRSAINERRRSSRD